MLNNTIYRSFLKRPFELLLIFGFLPILVIIFSLVALMVKIKIGSPIFFKQQRPGINKKIFSMYKFRTMTEEIDENGNLADDDFRLTRFGKFLRSTSLDEIPGLLSVIKGDMSLVGPRPLLVEYLPYYSEKQARRHEVRPGITGWAQVNGRNAITWEEKFEFDLWYIDNLTIWLDIKILWLTLKKVLVKDGISPKNQTIMPRFDLMMMKRKKSDEK